jgi:hypothetical protein
VITNGHYTTVGGLSFAGRLLQVDDGRCRLEPGNNLVFNVRNVTVNDGGEIWQDRDTMTMLGDALTLNGAFNTGMLLPDRGANMKLEFDAVNGSGPVIITGNNAGTAWFTGTPDLSGFTGEFVVEANNNIARLRFDCDVTTPTFSIRLTDLDIRDGINGNPDMHGVYVLSSNVTVTAFTMEDFGPGDPPAVIVPTISLPAGTYALDADVLNANPTYIDLSNVGGTDYSAFFVDQGGTITVESGVVTPEITAAAVSSGVATISIAGDPDTTYVCRSTTVLPGSFVAVATTPSPIVTDGDGNATFTVDAADVTRFYLVEE